MVSNPFPSVPTLNDLTCSQIFLLSIMIYNVSYLFQSFPKNPRIDGSCFPIVSCYFQCLFGVHMISNTNIDKFNINQKQQTKPITISQHRSNSETDSQSQSKLILCLGHPVGLRAAGTLRGYTSGILLGIPFLGDTAVEGVLQQHNPQKLISAVIVNACNGFRTPASTILIKTKRNQSQPTNIGQIEKQ